MMRALLALCLLLAPVVAGAEVHFVPSGDPAMAAAIAEARSTLDLFLSHALDAHGISLGPAMLKVGIPTPATGKIQEFIWLYPFQRFADGTFRGISTDDGVIVTTLKTGDEVHFLNAQIIDWSWTVDQPQVWGDYTTRMIAARDGLDPMQLFGKPFSPDPVPPEWRDQS